VATNADEVNAADYKYAVLKGKFTPYVLSLTVSNCLAFYSEFILVDLARHDAANPVPIPAGAPAWLAGILAPINANIAGINANIAGINANIAAINGRLGRIELVSIRVMITIIHVIYSRVLVLLCLPHHNFTLYELSTGI
jgi:hypothetical protein